MGQRKVTSNFKKEDAIIIFKNFQGEKSKFNKEGERNFGVLLSDEEADMLSEDGWNVKTLKPRPDDPDQYEQPWLPVKVKFGQIPPIAQLITERGKYSLDDETIGQLDWTRFKSCDVIIRPYNYEAFSGRDAGVAAYLKAIYVVKDEDEFERKYANIPDIQ